MLVKIHGKIPFESLNWTSGDVNLKNENAYYVSLDSVLHDPKCKKHIFYN